MAEELHTPELNAPGLSAAVEDPFQVDEVMFGDEGAVTLCITRGNNKPIYVQNVLMQHAMAMVDENKNIRETLCDGPEVGGNLCEAQSGI